MEKKYTIAEYTSLPSKGKVYTKTVVPEVHLSSMTTRHEMQRLSPSESQSKILSSILDDCILEDLGISAYDMCSGDYQFLMYKLREITYGKDIKLAVTCPYCLSKSEITVDLDTFEIKEYSDEMEDIRTFILPKSGNTIRLNLQTPRMLDRITEQAKLRKEKTKLHNVDYSLVYSLKEMIDTIDGKKPDKLDIENWIETLPMMDTNVILQHAAKLDTMIGVDDKLNLICDDCGREFISEFRITPEFFRPEIDF